MSFNKTTYIDNFIHHAKLCVRSAEKHFNQSFSNKLLFQIGYEEIYDQAIKQGNIKYLGGRLLKPEDIKYSDTFQAAAYTYVNGKLPSWINLCFIKEEKGISYIRVVTSSDLVDSENNLYKMPEGTTQFHILIEETT